jgi:hypothetical protein
LLLFEASSLLGQAEGFLHFPLCCPFSCAVLSSLIQDSILFFLLNDKNVNWPVLGGFLFTQASHVLSYFFGVTANGFNRVSVGRHLLRVKVVRRLKKHLFTAVSS